MQKPWSRSPWVTIWTSPKETFSKVLEYKPRYMHLFFATVVGLNYASYILSAGISNFNSWSRLVVVLLTIVLSPILALIFFRIGGWFMSKIGGWFGGSGGVEAATTVFIWANVPACLYFLMWVVNLIIARSMGASIILGNIPLMAVMAHYPGWAFTNWLVGLVLSIWSIVIYVSGISLVHKFSTAKAIGTWVIGSLFNTVIFFILSSFFVFFIGLVGGLIA